MQNEDKFIVELFDLTERDFDVVDFSAYDLYAKSSARISISNWILIAASVLLIAFAWYKIPVLDSVYEIAFVHLDAYENIFAEWYVDYVSVKAK